MLQCTVIFTHKVQAAHKHHHDSVLKTRVAARFNISVSHYPVTTYATVYTENGRCASNTNTDVPPLCSP